MGEYKYDSCRCILRANRVAQARQGSVVGRQQRHRKTSSHDNFSREYEQLPVEKLDTEIKRLSQKGESWIWIYYRITTGLI